MASPSPAPPESAARPASSREKRSNTRALADAGMPGPWSATSIRTEAPDAAARMTTSPEGGLCRTALSSRFASTWASRSGSARTTRSAGTDERITTSSRASDASRTACSISGASSTASASIGRVPESSRDRSSNWATSRPSRSVWASAVRMVTGSGAETPSTTFSSTARSPVMGVRSSWLTLATSSRRCRSTSPRSAAIALNALASSPTSSREVEFTRRV